MLIERKEMRIMPDTNKEAYENDLNEILNDAEKLARLGKGNAEEKERILSNIRTTIALMKNDYTVVEL
jgi:3-hydroxyacyl-CoA dehydrogenase